MEENAISGNGGEKVVSGRGKWERNTGGREGKEEVREKRKGKKK